MPFDLPSDDCDVLYQTTCLRCNKSRTSASQAPFVEACEACVAVIRALGRARLAKPRRVLQAFLGLVALSSLVSLVTYVQQLELLEGPSEVLTKEAASANDEVVGLALLLFLLAMFGSMVCWIVWHRRTHQLLSDQGRTLSFGRNAWGWIFVPLFCLWKPYQAVRELWLAGTRKQLADVPASFPLWWGGWLVYTLISNAANRVGPGTLDTLKGTFVLIEEGKLSKLINGTWVELAADLACAVTALLTIRMLREVDRAIDGQA